MSYAMSVAGCAAVVSTTSMKSASHAPEKYLNPPFWPSIAALHDDNK
jgi:hypothetical protein